MADRPAAQNLTDTMREALVKHVAPTDSEFSRGVRRVVIIRCGNLTTCVLELGPTNHKVSHFIHRSAGNAEVMARRLAVNHIDKIRLRNATALNSRVHCEEVARVEAHRNAAGDDRG